MIDWAMIGINYRTTLKKKDLILSVGIVSNIAIRNLRHSMKVGYNTLSALALSVLRIRLPKDCLVALNIGVSKFL